MASRQWIAPTIPYTPIDALNRRAAATGSVGYAMRCSSASYNGHTVSVNWNDYRRYYIAQYYFGERIVLARGTFENCLAAAMRYYRQGALGSQVLISARDDDSTADAVVSQYPELREGHEDEREWYTWRHSAAVHTVRDHALPGMMVMRFDWPLMQEATSEEDYRDRLVTKYGRAYC